MEDIGVVDKINHAGNWLVNNQKLLIHYAVNIIAAIIILFIGLLVSRLIARTLNRMMKARHIDATVADFVSAILRYGIVIFTLIAALNRIGVQTASVIAVIGAAGLAIGLALQGSLSNFAAGVLLVTFRHFHAGDYVNFAGTLGTVLVVQIFSTTLKTYDGKIVVVPNSKILSGNIINFSQEPNRLIDTIISVSYDADIGVVKKLITDILVADSRVIQQMGFTVRLNALGPSSMDFMVRAWVPRSDQQNATFDLLEKAKGALDEHNIGIPYPQMDVHLYRTPKAQNEQETQTANRAGVRRFSYRRGEPAGAIAAGRRYRQAGGLSLFACAKLSARCPGRIIGQGSGPRSPPPGIGFSPGAVCPAARQSLSVPPRANASSPHRACTPVCAPPFFWRATRRRGRSL